MSVASPIRVLLVDDNEDFTQVTSDLLTSAGYSVAVANEPMAALDAISRFRPDVCLLDIGLPGMDGYDLARKMRGWLPSLHIVAISGGTREPDREVESGAVLQAFIGKPFTYEALTAALNNISLPAEAPASN